jgi:uridine kinase
MGQETKALQRPFLLGITGPSGAGKTELARSISQRLNCLICSLDSYYRDLSNMPPGERAGQNFDDPAALDHELLFKQLNSLSQGTAVDRPVYDFVHHVRTRKVQVLQPCRVIILEGLFVLHWENVRRLLGLKIYVKADDQTCFERRSARDMLERGRTLESVHRQYHSTVRTMAQRYIYPTIAFADLVVSGKDPVDETSAAVMALLEKRLQGPTSSLRGPGI